MTLLGKSCLKYMVAPKPEIEARGYELVIFRSSGMGGRAFADLAAQGSFVVSGKSRLEAAGLAGIPQIVAPGAVDMVAFAVWGEMSPYYADRPVYTHNRLIASVTTPPDVSRRLARMIGHKLSLTTGRVTVLMPLPGVEDWDRPGEALHDPKDLPPLLKSCVLPLPPPATPIEVNAHISDLAFAEAVLDGWIAQGIVPRGQAVPD